MSRVAAATVRQTIPIPDVLLALHEIDARGVDGSRAASLLLSHSEMGRRHTKTGSTTWHP